MTERYENLESEIDWSKRTSMVITAPCGWARPIGKRPSRAQARAERAGVLRLCEGEGNPRA